VRIRLEHLHARAPPVTQRWTEKSAKKWYAKQPWLVGSNYIPASAINELEMWQADTFDPKRIDVELGWAESIGLNTMRVFFHDLCGSRMPRASKNASTLFCRLRINITSSRCSYCSIPVGIRIRILESNMNHDPACTIPVGCKVPEQKALEDSSQYPRLEAYVKGVVGAFAKDPRVLGWDVWNEPDNTNQGSYGELDAKNKVTLVLMLLPKVFDWARETHPTQPLTSGVWKGGWSSPEKLDATEKSRSKCPM